MKTDRNKNNVKSEENMILEKSRRSDANVFPVENKGKGKIARIASVYTNAMSDLKQLT